MKVGIYVGSFDPIHNGHTNIINYLLKQKIVDKVIIIATNDYWNKQINTSLKDRINMIKYFENENVIADTKCNNYEYTYQILNQIKKDNKDYDLHLIIGDDNLDNLDKWNNFEEIIKNKIIVVKRNKKEINLDKFKEKENFITLNDYKPINISSTYIRKNLLNKNQVLKMLNKNVYDYIIKNKLFIQDC